MAVVVTGASGFLGRILCDELLSQGETVFGADLLPNMHQALNYTHQVLDVTDLDAVEEFAKIVDNATTIYHLASEIDFRAETQSKLFENNVESTSNVVKLAELVKCRHVVFTSSNSIYLGLDNTTAIPNDAPPAPIDSYGKSKVESERILLSQNSFRSTIFRCPNILDVGRVGMLSIFFDFVRESKTCWLLGSGGNHYQCVYAKDLVMAMISSEQLNSSEVFNIGSSAFGTIREMYVAVIEHARSQSRVRSLPMRTSLLALKVLRKLGISPIGPYQFRMLTTDFSFETTYVTSKLKWGSTLSNNEMLCLAYDSYIGTDQNDTGANVSANSGSVRSLFINIVKRLS